MSLNGDVTDHLVFSHLREKGLLQSRMNNILPGLALQCSFIRPVPETIGAKSDYEQRYRIDPKTAPLLEQIAFNG